MCVCVCVCVCVCECVCVCMCLCIGTRRVLELGAHVNAPNDVARVDRDEWW